jgi:GTPase SAR1 family protein
MGKFRCCIKGSEPSLESKVTMSSTCVINVVMLGDYSVGKTSVLCRLGGIKRPQNPHPEKIEPLGYAFPKTLKFNLTVRGKNVRINLVDTGGKCFVT